MPWKSSQKTHAPKQMNRDSLQLTCLKAARQSKGLITYPTLQAMSASQQHQWRLLTTYTGENWDTHCACSHNFSSGVFLHTSCTNNQG